jgi:mitochondrial import inner membrane translocase subunit TIM44
MKGSTIAKYFTPRLVAKSHEQVVARFLSRPIVTLSHSNENSNILFPMYRIRTFSATVDKDPSKPSLKETVERLQRESDESSGKSNDTGDNPTDQSTKSQYVTKDYTAELVRRTADQWDRIKAEISSTWKDLVRSGERKSINKKIVHPTETAAGDAPYTGPVDIMVIDPELHLTAWERMQKRLTSAPIIQSILERTEEIYEKSGAKKVKERVDHIKEDAREAWETSQNPWVYRLSSVYDTVTAESSETRAVAELRILDPTFTLEDWRQDVVEHTLPNIMRWFLEGRINQLKPWLGEGVFKRIAAEMTAREQEGTQIDANVLAIMNSEIIAVEVRIYCVVTVITSLLPGKFAHTFVFSLFHL